MGCLPVVSKIPQHQETLGERALYFSANDSLQLARTLKSACDQSLNLSLEDLLEMRDFVKGKFGEQHVEKKWIEILRPS